MTHPVLAAVAALLFLTTVHAGMYNEFVTDLTPSNFDKLVLDSTETWLVKFYAPWCGHCKSSAPAFSKAAKRLDGVARLGVVNCDEHSALGQRFGVQGFPTIKIFKGEGRKARRPSDYNSERTAKAFVEQVNYVMPSFVARVKPSGADAFFQDLSALPHVLLFTDKTTTSPLYKGMSAAFKGKLSFGEVRKSDAAQLVDKYSVGKYPTLMAFQSGQSDPANATRFAGAMDPTSLRTFFSSLADGVEPQTDGEGAEAAPEESEKTFAQPKAYSGDVHVIKSTKEYEEVCGSRKDGRMCGLSLLPGGDSHVLFTDLAPIAEQYQYDNLAFAVIDSSVKGGSEFASLFSVDKDVGGFIVVRARKKKFAVLQSDGAPAKDTISAFVDRIVGGDARFQKLTAELPDWVAETQAESADDGESDAESGQCGTEPPKDGEACGESKEDL